MRGDLRGIGPSLPYSVKATVTRVRSAAWYVRSRGGSQGGLRILFYHRVSADRDELAVHPEMFRRHMDYLASAGYRALDVGQVADLLDRGKHRPGDRVELRRRVPRRGRERSSRTRRLRLQGDRLYCHRGHGRTRAFTWYSEQPPLLGWEQIVELDRSGTLEFEAHTVTHPNLRAVDDRRAALEIEGSKRELEERLGRPVTALCYPAGLFGERERALASEAGYRVAVSCEPGVNRPETERFALRRRQIDSRDTLLDFRAKVGGGHDTPLPLRDAYRRLRYGEGRPAAASRAE